MRRITIFRIFTLLYLAVVALLCFANFSQLPEVQQYFLGIPADKLVHFLMFLPFPILAFWSLAKKRTGVVKTLLVLAGLYALGCLIAWGTEYVQGLLPYREMDMADFKADRIGLACGSIIAFIIQLFTFRRADA